MTADEARKLSAGRPERAAAELLERCWKSIQQCADDGGNETVVYSRTWRLPDQQQRQVREELVANGFEVTDKITTYEDGSTGGVYWTIKW